MKLKTKGLAKFIAYMLGRNPWEFGLNPDVDGKFKLKNVLKALHALEGFKGLREGDLRELTYDLNHPVVRMDDKLIWATDTSAMAPRPADVTPPKPPPAPKPEVSPPKPAAPKPLPKQKMPPTNAGSFFLRLPEEGVSKEEKLARVKNEKKRKLERQVARKEKRSRHDDF